MTGPALRFSGVGASYRGGEAVLDAVSFEVGPGVTALVGPNGSGKSTLLRLGLGSMRPAAGRVEVFGALAHRLRGSALRRRVAYLGQRAVLTSAFRAREVVGLALGPGRRSIERDRRVEEALASVDALEHAGRVFQELSVGQQQLVMVARVVAQVGAGADPMLVLADEPTSAMDPQHAAVTAGVFGDFASEGHTVLTAAHDLSWACSAAGRAMVLDGGGRLVAHDDVGEALTADRLTRVFGTRIEPARSASGLSGLLTAPNRGV